MYFSTAGIDVSPFIPPIASFIVSFFMSMLGLSGAFLLIPFQISFLGYTNPSLSATNQLYNVISNPIGALQYTREKRMLWPLAWLIIAGGIPGMLIGSLLRIFYLADVRSFKMFVAGVLLIIGAKLIHSLFISYFSKEEKTGYKSTSCKAIIITQKSLRKISYTYNDQTYTFPVMSIFVLNIIVGIIGGIYGIGGGAIITPFLISLYKLPIHTLAGATLIGTSLTSITGVLFYTLLAPLYPHIAIAPDLSMALLLGVGGIFGMYLGARFQKYIPSTMLMLLMTLTIFAISVRYMIDYFYS